MCTAIVDCPQRVKTHPMKLLVVKLHVQTQFPMMTIFECRSTVSGSEGARLRDIKQQESKKRHRHSSIDSAYRFPVRMVSVALEYAASVYLRLQFRRQDLWMSMDTRHQTKTNSPSDSLCNFPLVDRS